jgi:hypothetical protein
MRLWPSTLWGNFVVGAAGAVFGPALLRPVLVGVVRTGYQVKGYASEAWDTAKREASEIKAEASATSEIESLRAEVAALRAQVKKASA